MYEEIADKVVVKFETQNQFRVLAPDSVAQGMLMLCEDENNQDELKRIKAGMMDLICNNVPKITTEQQTSKGVKTQTSPAYSATFTEPMIKDIDARYKEISVSKAHAKRMNDVKVFMSTYKPTISLSDALYRLSFYLIPNVNNLAKSTNNLIAFAKRFFEDTQNNMLVDSAILNGGQGKSTVQTGLKNAVEMMGMSAASCQLPSIKDGVQEVFVRNEVCIDEDSKFERVDYEALNKILDKQQITIKGKYIKEWTARSIANVLVGTNFLPTDVNARRYSIRMVDETFKLDENFGRWDIPGRIGELSVSYPQVVEWTTEAWLNLFYYVNKYNIKPLEYKEQSFDYGLLYKIQKALADQGSNVATISEMVKYFEQADGGDVFNWNTKQSYRNKLYILANQLKLEIVGDRKRNMFNTYDWTAALDIDDQNRSDPLEFVYCFFHNNEAFKGIDDSKSAE